MPIPAGSVGHAIVVTVTEDGAVVDLSTMTSAVIRIKKRGTSTTYALAASHVTDGTDGKITADTEAGQIPGPSGGMLDVVGVINWPDGDVTPTRIGTIPIAASL